MGAHTIDRCGYRNIGSYCHNELCEIREELGDEFLYRKLETVGRCTRTGAADWPERFDIGHSVAQHGYRDHQCCQPSDKR